MIDEAIVKREGALDYEKDSFSRKENLTMLDKLSALLHEEEQFVSKLNDENFQLGELNTKAKTPKPTRKKSQTVIPILIAVIAAVIAVCLLDSISILFVAIAAVCVVVLVLGIKKHKKRCEEWDAMIRSINAEITVQEGLVKKAADELDDFRKKEITPFVNKIVEKEKFSASYVSNINAVDIMRHLLIELRAEKVIDLINLYEELIFKSQVKQTFDGMQQSLKSAAISAERTARASERSATANESAAVAAAATAASMASVASSQRRQAAAAESAARSLNR